MLLGRAYGQAVLSMFVAVIRAMVVRGIKHALVGRRASAPGRSSPRHPSFVKRETRVAICKARSAPQRAVVVSGDFETQRLWRLRA